MQNLKRLFLFFFALACERNIIKTHSIESGVVLGQETVLFAGEFVGTFRTGNTLQAVAVKGLDQPAVLVAAQLRRGPEFRSCVSVEVDVLGCPS